MPTSAPQVRAQCWPPSLRWSLEVPALGWPGVGVLPQGPNSSLHGEHPSLPSPYRLYKNHSPRFHLRVEP